MVSGKYKNIMKNIMRKLVMIIMAAALMALPTMAQDWQSTSTMQGTGSSYAPQVTAVGAAGVSDMATTTESYSPAKAPSGPRRIGNFDNVPEGGTQENMSPIGDAVLPLLLMSLAFAGVIYSRKRRARV